MQYKSHSTNKDIIISPHQFIKKGGDGSVYKLNNDIAVKLYHTPADKEKSDKLKAMLAKPPRELFHIHNNKKYHRFAWPVDIIIDKSGRTMGFLMPYIDVASTIDIDNYYDNKKQKINNISPHETALSFRIHTMARNLALAIAELHTLGHHFVDLKPANIKVYRDTHFICLLDCDGFSIQGHNKRFPATLLTSEYIAPEALKSNSTPQSLGETQDQFALAVIFFQLMNNGIHPFQGVPLANINVQATDDYVKADLYSHGINKNPRIKPRPQSVHECFDIETRQMFDKAFTAHPRSRPTAREWQLHWQNRKLQQCASIKNDPLHIRFAGMNCPTCHLEKFAGKIRSTSHRSAIPTNSTVINIPASTPTKVTPIVKSPSTSSTKIWPIVVGIVVLIVVAIASQVR